MAEEKQPNGHATVGRARRMSEVVLQQLDERFQNEENIFLFLPNIIGKCTVCCACAVPYAPTSHEP